jgi:hypothetical protein
MKRSQKKYTKKNHKGGVVDKLGWDVSVSALKKKLDELDTRFGSFETRLGNTGNVSGPSREDNTGYGEAGYPEPTIGQYNPMVRKFVSSESTSEKNYNGSTSEKNDNGSTPIKDTQYAEVDSLNEEIKKLQSNPNKFNREKLKTKIGLKNALFAKYQKRVNYLENAQRATPLTQDENDELRNLKFNLDPNESLGGGRKSRRHRKSKRSTRRKRTRKYRK